MKYVTRTQLYILDFSFRMLVEIISNFPSLLVVSFVFFIFQHFETAQTLTGFPSSFAPQENETKRTVDAIIAIATSLCS
jgi:ABC-type amino acid transport system permease subunit